MIVISGTPKISIFAGEASYASRLKNGNKAATKVVNRKTMLIGASAAIHLNQSVNE